MEVEVAITGEQEVVGKQEGAMVMAGTYFLDHKQMTNGKNTLMRGKRKSMKGWQNSSEQKSQAGSNSKRGGAGNQNLSTVGTDDDVQSMISIPTTVVAWAWRNTSENTSKRN